MSTSKSLSLSLFGYNRRQVDQYMEEQATRIGELEKALEEQVEQLTQVEDALIKYTGMEQALKDGILDARVTGQKIIDDSTTEADRLIEHTNERVAQYKEEFTHESRRLMDDGIGLRDDLNDMKEQMQEVLTTYQAMLDNTDFDAMFPDATLDSWNEEVNKYEAEYLETAPRPEDQEKIWATSSITAEEKIELQRLIQEVIKNESHESAEEVEGVQRASNLVKFKPQQANK